MPPNAWWEQSRRVLEQNEQLKMMKIPPRFVLFLKSFFVARELFGSCLLSCENKRRVFARFNLFDFVMVF